jgi:hypothetical protein
LKSWSKVCWIMKTSSHFFCRIFTIILKEARSESSKSDGSVGIQRKMRKKGWGTQKALFAHRQLLTF